MHTWIVTIGSSDVQLDSDKASKAKGRKSKDFSAKVWHYWCDKNNIKDNCKLPYGSDPKTPVSDSSEDSYRVAGRVLGRVYNNNPANTQEEIWEYLNFPLLDNFVAVLESHPKPNLIFFLLTDQTKIFPGNIRSLKLSSPFWQDTCELQAIVEKYFQEKLPNARLKGINLQPGSEDQRLDNWDGVLNLIDSEFQTHLPKELPNNSIVYVSHQAGTPAISSAVQFCSLAMYGDRVKFLVGSEQNPQSPDILPSSSYLKGIRKQEAIRLLSRHDYSGVATLLEDYLQADGELETLLNAAKNWNVAKFNDYLNCLKHYPKFSTDVAERERDENWWWIAYEEVYLAIIREKQDNIVEAFFHSFRAFEYIFLGWGKQYFGQNIEPINEVPYLQPSALDATRNYFSSKKCKDVPDLKKLKEKLQRLKDEPSGEKIKNDDRVKLDMQTLCKFFKSSRYKEYKNDCGELEIFWDTKNNKKNNVSEKRNLIVHQAQGMSKTELQEFWTASEESDEMKDKSWENKLLTFLNFIIKEDFSEGFATLEDASLMLKVHEELEKTIAAL